jgi:hypothetical protein
MLSKTLSPESSTSYCDTATSAISSSSSFTTSGSGAPQQSGKLVVATCRPDAASPLSFTSPASPTSTTTSIAGKPPVAYDSEGNFSSGAMSSGSSGAGSARQGRKLSRHSDPKGSASSSVDPQTTARLRKYAQRNRPSRDKFNSQPASPCGIAGRSIASYQSEAQVTEENISLRLDQKMVKYDIFDDVDAERLKEFDDIFAKIVKNSNYEAHKKKSKDRKSKFSTASHVTSDEETGVSSIT